MTERIIEDAINDMLNGDAQKNALDLVAYIRAGEAPSEDSGEFPIVKYEGNEFLWFAKRDDKIVDLIYVSGSDDCPGPWTVWIRGDYIGEHADFPVDEHIKEFAWAHVAPCKPCSSDCDRGSRRTVFGKEFAKVCPDTMMFTNPDVEALGHIKSIMEIRNNDIAKSNNATLDCMNKL